MTKVFQLTPELIKDFRDKKILTQSEDSIPLELGAVMAGEQVIGELTAEESQILVELFNLKEDIEYWSKEILHRSLLSAAARVVSDEPIDLGILVSELDLLDAAEAAEFHEMQMRREFLQASLWYNVRKRTNTFQYFVGIRKNFTLVVTGKRFKEETPTTSVPSNEGN